MAETGWIIATPFVIAAACGGASWNAGRLAWSGEVLPRLTASNRCQWPCIKVSENSPQRRYIIFILRAFQRITQHGTNVIGFDPLHLPMRIKPLAFFNGPIQRDDVLMPGIAMQICDQSLDLGGRPFDPLEENTAAKHQHPSDAARDIATLRKLYQTNNLGIVDVFHGAAAVNEGFKDYSVGFKIVVVQEIEFIEHE